MASERFAVHCLAPRLLISLLDWRIAGTASVVAPRVP